MAGRPQRRAEYHEGTDAAQRFGESIGRILSVSKEDLAKREDAYQKSRAHRDRPGPKRRK